MNIRSKLSLNKVFLALILGIILVMSFSGCVENKVSAAEEINTSVSLINSAYLKVESAISAIGEGTYTASKTGLKAARVDYEEALKILNNASSDYEEETQDIERYIIFAETGLDTVSYSENTIVKFSESQIILEELKDSDYSEISVGAIEICGILTQLEKDLPHLEADCKYMEKGRYSQADAEFSKISDYY